MSVSIFGARWIAGPGRFRLIRTLLLTLMLGTLVRGSDSIISGGIYTITSQASGKNLTVVGSGTANGTAVVQSAPTGLENQQWRFDDMGSGSYRLTALCSGNVLDVSGVSKSDGAQVWTWHDVGAANQRWTIASVTNGFIKLISQNSGKCLDVAHASLADGATIDQWTDTGIASQAWHIDLVRPAGIVPGRAYQVIVQSSSKCLDVAAFGTANGTLVQQWAATGAANQQWKIDAVDGGYYRLTSVWSGLALDVSGGSLLDGAQAMTWADTGSDSQRWAIIDMGDGFFKLVSKNSGKALDVSGASTSNGAKIQQWVDNRGTNQRWSLTPILPAQAPLDGTAEGSSAPPQTYHITAGSGDQAITVTVGDVVLVTSTINGTDYVFNGCGSAATGSFAVTSGGGFTVSTAVAGTFTYQTFDAAGRQVATLTVTVVSTDLATQSIADEVGYTRKVTVHVSPNGAPIVFVASDPAALAVGIPTFAGNQATFTVTARKAGASGQVLAQIASPTGVTPIASRTVHGFTIKTSATQYIQVIEILPDGSHLDEATLTMSPLIRDLVVNMVTIVPGVTFDNSLTSKTVPTNSFTPSGANGTYVYRMIRVPTGWPHTCHQFWVTQNGVTVSHVD